MTSLAGTRPQPARDPVRWCRRSHVVVAKPRRAQRRRATERGILACRRSVSRHVASRHARASAAAVGTIGSLSRRSWSRVHFARLRRPRSRASVRARYRFRRSASTRRPGSRRVLCSGRRRRAHDAYAIAIATIRARTTSPRGLPGPGTRVASLLPWPTSASYDVCPQRFLEPPVHLAQVETLRVVAEVFVVEDLLVIASFASASMMMV